MRWHEITVYTTEEASEIISHFFHEYGAGGVAIEESGTLNKPRDTSLGQWYELPLNDIPEGQAVLKAYFSESVDVQDVLARMKVETEKLPGFGIDPGEPRWELREVDEEDWANAWKQYYKPVHITPRLAIKPTWEPYEPQAGEIVIEMDPGMAFGTGTHATTALCLRELERVVQNGDHVVDVGTGSGILAVAAAKLGASRVLALDLDPVAVSSARENIRLNGLDNVITVRESDLLSVVKRTDDPDSAFTSIFPVQVAVANILAEIIVTFVDDVYEALASGGTYIVSGVIKKKEDDVVRALRNARFTIERISYEEDWVAIVARKQ